MQDLVLRNSSNTLKVVFRTDRIGDGERFTILDIIGREPAEKSFGINFEREVQTYSDMKTFATNNNLILDKIVDGVSTEIIGSPTAINITTSLLYEIGLSTGAVEINTFDSPADVSGSLSGTYFFLRAASGTNYYVWFDVDNGSTDPAPAGYTGVEVDISADDNATTVGTAVTAAIDALVDFSASGTTTTTVTDATKGDVLVPIQDVDSGIASITNSQQGATQPLAEVTTFGAVADVAGSLGGKYFLVRSQAGTTYYVWFDVDSGSTDPEVAGATGVEIDISADDAAGTVGAAIVSALTALSDFSASGTTTVTLTQANKGTIPNGVAVEDVDSGITSITTTTAGADIQENQLAAEGGNPDATENPTTSNDGYIWSVSSGTLPTGMTLDPSGRLYGTPSGTGTTAITFQVEDAFGATDTQALNIKVVA